MADSKDSGGTPQKSYVSATVFWIVAAVLAIGIGAVYFVLDKNIDEGNKALSKQIKDSAEKQQKDLSAAVETINKAVAENVAKLEAATKAVVETAKKDKDELNATIAAADKKFAESVTKVQGTVTSLASEHNQTKADLGKVDQKVVYIEKEVKEMQSKLSGLNTQIGEIKTGSAALKAEQQKLQGEIAAVATKGTATEEELKGLVTRTREFEIKVLLEHAKQAAADIKNKNSYKSLLELVEENSPQPATPKK